MCYAIAVMGDIAGQAMAKSIEPSDTVTTGSIILLCLAVGMALAFEFVNGFHDTANAVATVIYTNSLKPWVAVVWSGLCNLAGVLLSPAGAGVAFTIVALLPAEMVINVGSGAGFAMVFALLLSAIIWNVGTWYMGLPASSTHTLIGAITGVGLCNAIMSGGTLAQGVNRDQLIKVMLTLLVSPIFGFVGAALLLLLSKLVFRWPALYTTPPKDTPPPLGVRALLIGTCTGVSFAHGSNDGQKGMGLLVLILIGVLPGVYALNLNTSPDQVHSLSAQAAMVADHLSPLKPGAGAASMNAETASDTLDKFLRTKTKCEPQTLAALAEVNRNIVSIVSAHKNLNELAADDRKALRADLYRTAATITQLGKLDDQAKAKKTVPPTDDATQKLLVAYKGKWIEPVTQYVPTWVKVATALALGIGTMIGWKRIVVTVGEKIGKAHLTYAQGASAELMAMATIFAADRLKMPVSTTHVLSSGIAGTMAANKSGLQASTVRNVLLAWLLTLPVCTLLGAGLFAAGLLVVLHNLVPVVVGLLTAAVVIATMIVIRRRAAGAGTMATAA
jgi:PiT family inorganic phosphate transporter